jgi:hypothetical protein
MTRPGLLFILVLLFAACNDNVNKTADNSDTNFVDSTKRSNEGQTSTDSIDVEYIPIYNSKTKSTSKNGPVFQALLDTLLQYKNVRELIKDSSACIYVINDQGNSSDTTKKAFRVSTKNISAAICNFDKTGCYLQIKFDYSNKSTIVINSCGGQDSLQLYEWNKKNCW